MKKSELVDSVLQDVEGVTPDQVSKIINSTFERIAKALVDGDYYSHDKFGTFKTVERAARKGRNPQTGDEIDIPAKLAVKLIVSRQLKDAVNK
jgi:DNA-binding protein HU-beta